MASASVHQLAAAAGGGGEEYFLPPEKLLQGNPRQTVWMQYTEPTGQFMAGIWHSERGRWKILYTEQEYCRMLVGISVITDQAGFDGIWEVLEPTRKHFVIYSSLNR